MKYLFHIVLFIVFCFNSLSQKKHFNQNKINFNHNDFLYSEKYKLKNKNELKNKSWKFRLSSNAVFSYNKQFLDFTLTRKNIGDFGCFLSFQGGNYGTKEYFKASKTLIGKPSSFYDAAYFNVSHKGILIGIGASYLKYFQRFLFLESAVAIHVGPQTETFHLIYDYDSKIIDEKHSRIHSSFSYEISLGFHFSQKIGVKTSIILPFYLPITKKFYETNVNIINLAFEPAFSLGFNYFWK